MKPSVWLIAGPTASGKSALAIRLATAIGGEVVNADSMQLYAGLEVLSAAPSASERTKAPHHLYGVADPGEAWSVGRWLRAAERMLVEVAARGHATILVGGTGLYFRALTSGLADIPAVPESVRAEAQIVFSQQGEAAFRETLSRHDPSAARDILPGDRQRLLRAWSVAAFTGRSLSDWQASTRPIFEHDASRAVVLEPPRAELYARCDARLAAMVAHGALEEVTALERRGLSPDLPAMKALGVRELAAHLRGESSLDGAVASAQLATRHYAKRQLTWFRNQTPAWPRIPSADPEAQWEALRALLPST